MARTVRGHFDGQVVVLDEPAPCDCETNVVVAFPDAKAHLPQPRARGFHWVEPGSAEPANGPSAADEVIRQRREE